jgi:hypothetical protein
MLWLGIVEDFVAMMVLLARDRVSVSRSAARERAPASTKTAMPSSSQCFYSLENIWMRRADWISDRGRNAHY